MKVLNVLLDTSFLNRVKEGKFSIEEEFPGSRIWVSDTVVQEFCLSHGGGKLEWHEREHACSLFKKYNLHHQKTEAVILIEEYLEGPQAIALESDQQQLHSFLDGTSKNQKEEEKQWEDYEESRRIANEEIWTSIQPSRGFNEVTLDFNKIEEEVKEFLENPSAIKEYLLGIFDTLLGNYKTFLDKSNLTPAVNYIINQIEAATSSKNIVDELPTFYNLIRFHFFMERIKKTERFLKSKGKLQIKLSNELAMYMENPEMHPEEKNPKLISMLEISKNLLPDFRAFLPALHYVNVFVTCDFTQAVIMKYLFPNYAPKVRYYKQPNLNKT